MLTGAIASIIWFCVFGYIGSLIADGKSRSSTEGFLLGGFLGPIGWIIEWLLPGGEE